MQPERDRGRPLSPDHAFVVQFRTETDIEAGHLAGRVEHVVTGQSASFDSLETLLDFMRRILEERREDDAQDM